MKKLSAVLVLVVALSTSESAQASQRRVVNPQSYMQTLQRLIQQRHPQGCSCQQRGRCNFCQAQARQHQQSYPQQRQQPAYQYSPYRYADTYPARDSRYQYANGGYAYAPAVTNYHSFDYIPNWSMNGPGNNGYAGYVVQQPSLYEYDRPRVQQVAFRQEAAQQQVVRRHEEHHEHRIVHGGSSGSGLQTAAMRELAALERQLAAAIRAQTAATVEQTGAIRENTAAVREQTAAQRELAEMERQLAVAIRARDQSSAVCAK